MKHAYLKPLLLGPLSEYVGSSTSEKVKLWGVRVALSYNRFGSHKVLLYLLAAFSG